MCLVAIAVEAHPRFSMIIAANRDEFHVRPSLPAHPWEDLPGIFGGRDLKDGGSWFSVDASGRFALVTNIRRFPLREGRSRGELVAQFLASPEDLTTQAKRVAAEATRYRPFNLVLGAAGRIYFINSDRCEAQALAPGIHGLSNADLNTPWAKTLRLTAALSEYCARGDASLEPLWSALADRTIAPDAKLPDTGIGLERERFLSSAFIVGETYGTRASTLLTVDEAGRVQLIERGFGPNGTALGEHWLESGTANAG